MRIAILAVALLVTAACSQTVKVETDPATGRTDVDIQAPGVPQGWTATIAAVGTTGITGTATGTSASSMTHVILNIRGATAGATLPWHVHEGSCGDAGPPIVGAASAYPALIVAADGTARAEAHVSAELNEAKSYIINVHASPTNLATIVACGDYND